MGAQNGGSQFKFCIFGRTFSEKKKIFRQPKPPYHDSIVANSSIITSAENS